MHAVKRAQAATLDELEAEHCAVDTLAKAEMEYDAATETLSSATLARQEAERALADATAAEEEALSRVIEAKAWTTAANTARNSATKSRMHAEADEARLEAERDDAEWEEKELWSSFAAYTADEEAKHEEELAEKIRRMNELRMMEEQDRSAKRKNEEQERRDAERQKREAERKAKEAAEREAREAADRKAREERERQDAKALQYAEYLRASAKERERCRTRDSARLNSLSSRWTATQAVTWYNVVSAEFDTIEFCKEQPLTFESVPWPLLTSPTKSNADDITWNSVEDFFSAAKTQLSETEFRFIIGKAKLRFHPDRWKARKLLHTVLDLDLQARLEDAGNIVAQAINALISASPSL